MPIAKDHELLSEMIIPSIGLYHRSTVDYSGFEDQTYEDFAQQMDRNNPSVELTRETVDAAFRHAASLLTSNETSEGRKIDTMVNRVSKIHSRRPATRKTC